MTILPVLRILATFFKECDYRIISIVTLSESTLVFVENVVSIQLFERFRKKI